MTSVGETLRRERLKRNLSLDRISGELKISSRLLDAIEQEHFEKLPGGVFTKSFVRQYAHFLGLDAEEISGEVQRILDPQPLATGVPGIPEPPPPEIPLPRMKGWEAVADGGFRWSSSLPALGLVVLVMLICSGVYSLWQRSRRPVLPPGAQTTVAHATPAPHPKPKETAEAPEKPKETPDASAKPKEAPEAGVAPNDTHPSASATASTNPATPSTPPASPAGPAAAPANSAERQLSPAPAEANSNANAEANPNAPVRVQLTADEPVWVSITVDGKTSFAGTLDAKQIRTVAANEKVVLRVGNAGGINVLLNGKPIGPLGPKGQIRTLQLTSGGFKIVAPDASKPASPERPSGPVAFDPL